MIGKHQRFVNAPADKKGLSLAGIRRKAEAGKPWATAPRGNRFCAPSRLNAPADKNAPVRGYRSPERSESGYNRVGGAAAGGGMATRVPCPRQEPEKGNAASTRPQP